MRKVSLFGIAMIVIAAGIAARASSGHSAVKPPTGLAEIDPLSLMANGYRRRGQHRSGTAFGGAAMLSIFRLSVGSHLAATVVGAVAAAAYLTVYSETPQSFADYISAICTKSFGSAPAAEAPYLAENVSAMTKMMVDMSIKPSGDVDRDFVATMVPHHQGAIEMAQAELRYGRNEPLRRMAQEIIVTQTQEITAMRLSLGQPLPPPVSSPDQIPPVATADRNEATQQTQ
jgi:hypothetical protein